MSAVRRCRIVGICVIVVLVAAGSIACLFRQKQKRERLCYVTQYSDATGQQANFYTITKGDHLIIIDGGWAENADAVRKVISEHGNHVDAWFISHTHSDHVGAFNEIYSNLQGIKIDYIYDNGYDYEFLMDAGEPWDGNGLAPLTVS